MPNLSVEENIFIGREPNSGRVRPLAGAAPADRRRCSTGSASRLDPGAIVRDLSRRRAADGRDRQGALPQRPPRHHGRADLRADRHRGRRRCFAHHPRARRRVGWRSSTSPTASTRSSRSAIGSRCCATASSPASCRSRRRRRTAIVRLMVGRALGDLFRPEEAERRSTRWPSAPAPCSRCAVSAAPARSRTPRRSCSRTSPSACAPGEIVGLGRAGRVRPHRDGPRHLRRRSRSTAARSSSTAGRSRIRSPRDAIRLGIGLVPEDRKLQALVLQLAVRENAGALAARPARPLRSCGSARSARWRGGSSTRCGCARRRSSRRC